MFCILLYSYTAVLNCILPPLQHIHYVCMCTCQSRWNSISDKMVLLRNSIFQSNSLTSLQSHCILHHQPPTNSVSIYFFPIGLSILVFISIPALFPRCHFILLLQRVCIHLCLMCNMCQIKSHGCWHFDINLIRIFYSPMMNIYEQL